MTLRDRDSLEQTRVPIEGLAEELAGRLEQPWASPKLERAMGLNLADAVTGSAERHGDELAVRLDQIQLTYSQLDEMTAQAAAMLRDRGVEPRRPGRADAAQRPRLRRPLLRRSCAPAGIVVPMNVMLKRREVGYFLEDSGARLLLTSDDVREEAEAGAAEARRGGDGAGARRAAEMARALRGRAGGSPKPTPRTRR